METVNTALTVNIESALRIPGWMRPDELAHLAQLASRPGTRAVVEVGSWNGRSSRALADNLRPGSVLWCVDNWSDGGDGKGGGTEAERAFDLNLADHLEAGRVGKVRMGSVAAARFLAQAGVVADLLFIDADHQYESVRADILAWRGLVREESWDQPAGVLSGHDFCRSWPGVQQAVRELVPSFSVVGTIWASDGSLDWIK